MRKEGCRRFLEGKEIGTRDCVLAECRHPEVRRKSGSIVYKMAVDLECAARPDGVNSVSRDCKFPVFLMRMVSHS